MGQLDAHVNIRRVTNEGIRCNRLFTYVAFLRFGNLLSNLGYMLMRLLSDVFYTIPYTHHTSVSNVDWRGRVHTNLLVTTSLRNCVPPQITYDTGPNLHGCLAPTSSTVNHAFLCMDATGQIFMHELIDYVPKTGSDVYTASTCKMQYTVCSDSMQLVAFGNPSSSTGVPTRSASEATPTIPPQDVIKTIAETTITS